MLEFLPPWFQIFFFSMIPWLEARYIIPFAMLHYGWEWWQAFPLAIAGNILPIPFILLFFHLVEKFLRRYTFWSNLMDWLFARTRRKATSRITKYESLGLFAFVALPLPFTGAWTGALIAYLFDLKISRSLLIIFLGLLSAAVIMIVLTLNVRWILSYLGIHV
ncbi:MAG: small multi-drug export protein [Candidatus Thermoplasmatota archaeon]|nr:small multi-drug export protein [Candidatus Thermoplasmatota archaeon]